jgi:hypothetical protein
MKIELMARCLTVGLLLTCAKAAEFSSISGSEKLTAVSSRVFNGYERATREDGSFRPETYGFAVGGNIVGRGRCTADASIDAITFAEIEAVIVGPLASQHYVPSDDPGKAELLILVSWGRTIGSSAFNATNFAYEQDATDAGNARLLGIDSGRVFSVDFNDSVRSYLLKSVHADLTDAVRADRYFVILQAFECRSAFAGSHPKLLWETRLSLSQRRHDFREDLPKMVEVAAHFFGQDTDGVVIKPIPEGRVEMGAPRSLGDVPAR